LITSLGYTKKTQKNNEHNENSKKHRPIIARTTWDHSHTVITENLKEHKTLLSSIFWFGELV